MDKSLLTIDVSRTEYIQYYKDNAYGLHIKHLYNCFSGLKSPGSDDWINMMQLTVL